MYERDETKTTTASDGTSFHHKIKERSTSGVVELLLIPVGITLSAVTCFLIIKIGVQVLNVMDSPTPSAHVVRENP